MNIHVSILSGGSNRCGLGTINKFIISFGLSYIVSYREPQSSVQRSTIRGHLQRVIKTHQIRDDVLKGKSNKYFADSHSLFVLHFTTSQTLYIAANISYSKSTHTTFILHLKIPFIMIMFYMKHKNFK